MKDNVYIPNARKKGDCNCAFETEQIICMVEEYFEVHRSFFTQKSKKHGVVYVRQICQYLLAKYTQLTLGGVGEIFGQKDNASVVNSLQSIKNYVVTDENVRNQLSELENKLQSLINKNGNTD
jgi:chromosomal replication initiation ATPase DnaA